MPVTTIAGNPVETGHWIGGKRIDSSRRFRSVSPVDQQPLGEFARGGTREADAAVRAASEAFPTWSRTPAETRAELLHRIADEVERRIPELATVETADNGALLRSHVRSVMPRVAHNFRFFADWLTGELSHPEFDTRGHRNAVSWDPSGVCVLITPWNAPLMLESWKVAPALAAGNTVVLKPAEWSPATASVLADITAVAGLPDGVFNVVQGLGPEVGAPLCAHPDVARISFTGSEATARRIAAAAAENLTPLSMELGGKSPLLVFDDADLELAVALAVEQYDNAGQVCLAATRILVHSPVAEEFTARLRTAIGEIKQGDPRKDDTDVGPNIHPDHVARIDGFVRRAVASGARVLEGGGPNTELGGTYYRPTLLDQVRPGAEILREEVFGPVLTLEVFDTEREAVARADDTRFGLAATVVTSDPERARRVSAELTAGTVWVNCFFVRDLRAPFGGARHSGIGREGGTWSFDFFCDVKNTVTGPKGWR
ncbi:aldehyde dehydrogenase [Saccharomonospora glauca]|jgi:acyl-CoA reductase-like NAD-dependent aldehyde dehydrogenase|uniref:NAD-dependent aldehyde dehydrogenase n=1 Tax=Saccharomonospora glauca K62 TaxID=928724 RepID=I1D2F5_9PSEU|nr:aldehyde dehydrogenase [Saccharomonospora glauca]EIE99129.1 NAD-dependent aldehyde dehydrogenase [Saccharomonospora glauca K62]